MNHISYELYFIFVVEMKRGLAETCYLFFLTLANPTRLAILELLRKGSRNVTEIAETLKQEQSMISHNLKPLERCRFVFSQKREKKRLYSLNTETLEPLFKLVDYHSKKYCPTKGKCLSVRDLKKLRKKEALKPLYVKKQ